MLAIKHQPNIDRRDGAGNADIDDGIGMKFPDDRIGEQGGIDLADPTAYQHNLLFPDAAAIEGAAV